MKNWTKIALVAILLASLGLMGATGLRSNAQIEWNAESVNLALRQVAHQLYKLCDNHTERIEAVEQSGDFVFSIRVEEYVDYDMLPSLIDKALKDFGLPSKYEVALKNCEDDQIELGYTYIALTRNEVACRGREYDLNCSKIQITFYEPKSESSLFNYLLITLLLGSIIGLLLFKFASVKEEEEVDNVALPKAKSEVKDNSISIGKFRFDHINQSLTTQEEITSLTFRESKLLHYLATHANQVLSRDQIQANVWEDEGVIVGRSLDVFISRLRKILKSDDSIQIKSVHGVGYRLELK